VCEESERIKKQKGFSLKELSSLVHPACSTQRQKKKENHPKIIVGVISRKITYLWESGENENYTIT